MYVSAPTSRLCPISLLYHAKLPFSTFSAKHSHNLSLLPSAFSIAFPLSPLPLFYILYLFYSFYNIYSFYLLYPVFLPFPIFFSLPFLPITFLKPFRCSYFLSPFIFFVFFLEKSSFKILPCCIKFLPLHSLSGRSVFPSRLIGSSLTDCEHWIYSVAPFPASPCRGRSDRAPQHRQVPSYDILQDNRAGEPGRTDTPFSGDTYK